MPNYSKEKGTEALGMIYWTSALWIPFLVFSFTDFKFSDHPILSILWAVQYIAVLFYSIGKESK